MTASGTKVASENHVPSTPVSSKSEKTSIPTTPSTPGLFSSVAAAGINSTNPVKPMVNVNDENSAPSILSNDTTTSLDNLARRRQIANGNSSIHDVLATKSFSSSLQSTTGNKEENLISIQQQISPKEQNTLPVNSMMSIDTENEIIDNDVMEQAIAATQHMKISMNAGYHGSTSQIGPFHKSPPRLEDLQILIDLAFEKMPQQTDSEFARSYLPRVPVNSTIISYPRSVHPTMETLDYYLRLSVESLFFTFYYMEVSK